MTDQRDQGDRFQGHFSIDQNEASMLYATERQWPAFDGFYSLYNAPHFEMTLPAAGLGDFYHSSLPTFLSPEPYPHGLSIQTRFNRVYQRTTSPRPSPLVTPPITPSSIDHAPTESATVFEQQPRYAGDMYTPRKVRYEGKDKEGLCHFCEHEEWFALKQSGYWYHMRFTHGISYRTGKRFDGPAMTRPMKAAKDAAGHDAQEGFCGKCRSWVPMKGRALSGKPASNKWYKHADKCQEGPKLERQAKRQRN